MISRRIIFYSTALALAWALVPGCSTKNASEAGALGTAQAAVENVPTDGSVACISVTATGAFSTTQSFDVTPGESTVFTLDGIPTGTVRFDGSAYPTACAAVTPGSTPTWASAPVLATVTIGQMTMVTLDMNQAGGAGVGVSFNPPPPCRSEGMPCLSGGECCSGACGADNNCAPAGSVCGPGATLCNGACTDLGSDPKNCGACGLFCPPGDACLMGTCACPPGSLLCAPGLCTDLSTDPGNCGGCGIACPPPLGCVAGKCTGPCTPKGGPCGANAQCCSGQCDAPGICGGGPQCQAATDCPPSPTACAVPVCNGGLCGTVDLPVGAPCAQAGGVVCDGAGDCVQCLTANECPAGLVCTAGKCTGGCVPLTCAQLGYQCGIWTDNCGDVLQCGDCPAGLTCGGGGAPPGVCSASQCQVAADCPPSPTPCSLPTCTNGVCGTVPAPNGTVCAPGACNGTVFISPSICIASTCTLGTPINCAGGGVCNPATGCMPPSCTDGILDGAETGIDCGGPACPPCLTGGKCLVDSDCASGACDALTLTCDANPCVDHQRDGNETDVDCGGGTCPACAPGQKCFVDSDCITNACDAVALICVVNQCSDHRQDGNETDVDCGGGTCPSCAIGKRCATNFDCMPGHTCGGGVCM